jgi:hypothetical protein
MLGLVIACVLYLLPCHGVNYNLLYMLLGCTLPDTSLTKICMLLTGIGLGYVFFVSYRKWESDYYWLSLNLFFYLQMQLLYYVWYPSTAHFLVLAPTIILGCLAVLAFLCKPKQDAIPGLNLAVVVSLIGLYIPSYYKFYQEKMTHQQLFATHVVHDWRFPYAQFQTTMEPNLFADTRQLIDKYSSLPAIYLLSKYDAIIPVLVQRYNRLPVVNLALDLISQRDITRCKQVIDQDKPQYLFVDSDSHRDMRGDILVAGDDREYSESYGRFGVMRNLKSLFDQIREDYVLQESGSLISVYKRKVGV